VKCLCDGEFEYLYKAPPSPPSRGDVEKEAEHFAELVMQYTEAMEGENVKLYDNAKKIASLMAKIRILESSLGLVEKIPDNVKSVLKLLGIRLTNNAENNVLIIHGKINGFTREYSNILEKDSKDSKDKKPTVNQYIDILTAISSHFKIHLDIHTVSVASFCSYYKQFTKEIEALNRIGQK